MNNKVMLVTAVLLVAFGGCRPRQEEGTEGEHNAPQAAPEEPTMRTRPGDGMEGERAKPGETMERKGAEATQGTGTSARTLAVGDIAEKPDMHIGQRITVAGEVDDVLADHALTVKGEGEKLIVLGRKNAAWMANKDMSDKHVLATGTLQRMSSPAELEQNLGLTLDSKTQDELKDAKVVLIATSLQPIESEPMKTRQHPQPAK
jgi:hypothetical protein